MYIKGLEVGVFGWGFRLGFSGWGFFKPQVSWSYGLGVFGWGFPLKIVRSVVMSVKMAVREAMKIKGAVLLFLLIISSISLGGDAMKRASHGGAGGDDGARQGFDPNAAGILTLSYRV